MATSGHVHDGNIQAWKPAPKKVLYFGLATQLSLRELAGCLWIMLMLVLSDGLQVDQRMSGSAACPAARQRHTAWNGAPALRKTACVILCSRVAMHGTCRPHLSRQPACQIIWQHCMVIRSDSSWMSHLGCSHGPALKASWSSGDHAAAPTPNGLNSKPHLVVLLGRMRYVHSMALLVLEPYAWLDVPVALAAWKLAMCIVCKVSRCFRLPLKLHNMGGICCDLTAAKASPPFLV